MSNFSETLNDLLQENNLTAQNFASQLGVSTTTICRYLNDKHSPKLSAIVMLADFFNCTSDYILGLEHYSNVSSFNKCPPFGERLHKIITERSYTPYRFCKEAKILQSNYSKWKNGKSEPTSLSLIKIAKFLDCSVDYLIGREK